ncbi:MAG: hypothetical protein VKP72_11495 [bacterium]|nr:hypothetical protein [bacterium]
MSLHPNALARPSRIVLAIAGLSLVTSCARIDEKLNQLGRSWDNSPKTVTLFSVSGAPVRTYDIGRSKVTRAEGGDGSYIYFYANGKYIQTNMPYVVEAR